MSDHEVEITVLPPWRCPPQFKQPKAVLEHGYLHVIGYVEGGEDGTPAIGLPDDLAHLSGVYVTPEGRFEAADGVIRVWRH